MGLLKRRTVLLGVSTLLAATAMVFADQVVDAEFDNNENEFENYWYYFDDNAGAGKDDRPTAGVGTTPSTINVKDTTRLRNLYPGDTYVQKDYKFTPGTQLTNSFASMPYTMGSPWKTSWGDAQPFVGMGTMLAEQGKGCDLTGATGISFRIKSRNSALTVKFKVQVLAIDKYSEVQAPPPGSFAYHEIAVPVTTSWAVQTVTLTDLKLPDWAIGPTNPQNHKIPFDIKTVTKIAWEVKKEDNASTTSDTLDIDDITVVGTYKFVSPAIWLKTASTTVPTTGAFTTFEANVPHKNELGYYWYAYNDVQIGGTSSVSAGAKPQSNGLLKLDLADGSGSGGTGKGAMLNFQLGPSVKQGANDVQGFVGVGCNTYDSASSIYWNATKDGASSIYFHYLLNGDAKKATLEISDWNDVGDATAPTRKDSRGSGIVMYRDLPLTPDTQFNAVEIPFDSLIYHSGWQGSKDIKLDKTKLAKIQWKVQGANGKTGSIVVDNVYFPGVTAFTMPPTNSGVVVSKFSAAKNSAFNATYLNGNIHINWTNKASVASGTFSLVNTQGAVIATAPVAKTAFSVSANNLSTGMYFVKMNAVDANGKVIATQTPVTIVK